MEVAVVGAGIVGTLTAHYLREFGCQVTVYDRSTGPAEETSRANGGQLSYSFCDAMADPQLIPKLPGIIAGLDPAFQIGISLRPSFISWGLKFIRQCTARARDNNTIALLSLALRSSELMQPLTEQFGKQAAFGRSGKLVLLDQPADAETERRVGIKNDHGFDVKLLTPEQIWEIEPSLKNLTEKPEAAIYSPSDEVANAFSFTQCIARSLQGRGVAFRFGEDVSALQPLADGRCRLVTASGEDEFDAVVLATGDAALNLLEGHGVKLPILPMSGYSWTFPATAASPTTSITALSKRIVFSRLGDSVRVAGFADVNPRQGSLQQRTDALREVAVSLMPDGADYDRPIGDPWHGRRAMTPDSRPILGKTRVPGVYANLGHGMLGWTLGAATSEQVARLITHKADKQ